MRDESRLYRPVVYSASTYAETVEGGIECCKVDLSPAATNIAENKMNESPLFILISVAIIIIRITTMIELVIVAKHDEHYLL